MFLCFFLIVHQPRAVRKPILHFPGQGQTRARRKLKTDVNGLESAGFWVLSAGLDAYHGDEMDAGS